MRVVFVLALLAACARGPSPPKADTSGAPLVVNRVFDRQDGICDAGGAGCVTFHAEYPEVVGGTAPEAGERINAAVRSWLLRPFDERGTAASPADVADQLIAAWRATRARFPESPTGWQVRRIARVLVRTPAVLSLALDEDGYTGGAHPFASRTFVTVRSATGAPIALGDLLVDGGEPRLRALVEAGFREARRIPPGATLASAGFTFADERLALPEGFGVVAEGLAFHWNAYDVGPYYLGPTDVMVPWADLGGLLRSDAGLPPRGAGGSP